MYDFLLVDKTEIAFIERTRKTTYTVSVECGYPFAMMMNDVLMGLPPQKKRPKRINLSSENRLAAGCIRTFEISARWKIQSEYQQSSSIFTKFAVSHTEFFWPFSSIW